MFATPGWSISSSNIQKEAEPSKRAKKAAKDGKKRKREDGSPKDRPPPSSGDGGRDQKRYKKSKVAWQKLKHGKGLSRVRKPDWVLEAAEDAAQADPAVGQEFSPDRPDEGDPLEPEASENHQQKAKRLKQLVDAKDGLTPLQQSMRQKLLSARFRHLNEALYTGSSTNAMGMFLTQPALYKDYHLGFQQQVALWPSNPVDVFIRRLEMRGKIAKVSRKHKKEKNRELDEPAEKTPLTQSPLPRTRDICTVADLGCGDAQLAQHLESQKAKLKLDILSYDLQSTNEFVQLADISKLPRPEATVDVAIFCLSLMGTNWPMFIDEAYRVLRWKGELWIAEIKSRFGRVKGGSNLGKRQAGPPQRQILGADPEEEEGVDRYLEPKLNNDREDQTDLTAFTKTLERRGFVVDERSTDRSNRMFISMVFVKSGTIARELQKDPDGTPKFINKKRVVQMHDEAKVLKPCLYKTR